MISYVIFLVCLSCTCWAGEYDIGVGIADITGPASDVNLMGYANPAQTAAGIHLRQFSRAFIIDGRRGSRVVFVNTDACMATDPLKKEVIRQLREKGLGIYNTSNVCISGTHTHSGPAGFHQYLLYDITALGFVRSTWMAYANGIVQSIVDAHQNLTSGSIFINHGNLTDASINRSPSAYQNNPADERSKYQDDTDKEMTVLKFVRDDGKTVGLISWFATHCTSMNNTNRLISSDNKGLAALMVEQQLYETLQPARKWLPGARDGFVAAFAQSNEGDVSPNTKGPHCLNSGLPCDLDTSTCDGKSQLCIASGPGVDMFDSTQIIAKKQADKALELLNASSSVLSGPVAYRHQFINMTNLHWTTNGPTEKFTCPTSMGFSFAAGTVDGPGAFDFKQGDTTGNPLWDFVRNFIKKPSPDLSKCHHPKPILLATGEISFPYEWQPSIVASQVFRIGQVLLLAVPGEFTTMSGRRLRDAVKRQLNTTWQDAVPIIAGLANTYSSYITTYEEYQVQRYEGASTIYGPHTLEAHIRQFEKLTLDLALNRSTDPGPSPPDFVTNNTVYSFLPGVIFDSPDLMKSFGDVLQQPLDSYQKGDTVRVKFVSASPRNDVMHGKTFLAVQSRLSDNYITQYTDASWETRFYWNRESTLRGTSNAVITWTIPMTQEPGVYRVCHYGNAKSLFDKTPKSFEGCSRDFTVQ